MISPEALPEGTVTILFTDIVGSTELTNRVGDDEARAAMHKVEDLVREQLADHRGFEVKGTGDGLMLAFQSARRAIGCASAIQRAVTRHPATKDLGLCIGLSTGEVIHEDDDLFGATVNLAARVAGEASGGEILISDNVRGVLGSAGGIELKDRGEVPLKGFEEPVSLYEVLWERDSVDVLAAERTPLIGRKDERAQLSKLLAEAEAGHGSLALISGEPGVGKTRLTEELEAEGVAKGFLVLRGQCRDQDLATPFGPFVEMLEEAARRLPASTFREALGEAAPDAAKLLPQLLTRFDDIGPPMELPPEQEVQYLLGQLRQFLERLSIHQPLILLWEDMHWADESSLNLLRYLAHRVTSERSVFVATYRDTELQIARPLADAVRELMRLRSTVQIDLKALTEAGVQALLRAKSGSDPPDQIKRAIFAETDGVPFFVEEVYRHLLENGTLIGSDGTWRSDGVVGSMEIPASVQLVIGRRLEVLSEVARGALTQAAVIGRAFEYVVVAALAESEEELLDAIDEGLAASLIRDISVDSSARYEFTHELVRQTLLGTLSLPRRLRVHLQIATALDGTKGLTEETASDLAFHWYQVADLADQERAGPAFALAGELALRKSAFEEALELFDLAAPWLPNADPGRQAGLSRGRALCLQCLGRGDEAAGEWRQAIRLLAEVNDHSGVAEFATEFSQLASWGLRGTDNEYLRGVVDRHLTVSELESRARCQLLLVWARSALFDPAATATQLSAITEALELARVLGDGRLLGRVLQAKGDIEFSLGRLNDQRDSDGEAAELLEAVDPYMTAQALAGSSAAACLGGDFETSERLGARARELAERTGNAGALWVESSFQFERDLARTRSLGELDEAADELVQSREDLNLGWDAPAARRKLRFLQGRTAEALEDYGAAGIDSLSDRFDVYTPVQFKALVLAYAHRPDEALRLLGESREPQSVVDRPRLIGEWDRICYETEAWALLGDAARASQGASVNELLKRGLVLRAGLTERIAGIAASAGRDFDEAERWFLQSLKRAQDAPVVYEQPQVRYWYARMLLDRDEPGDREKARGLLTEAIAHHGMPKHLEMAEELLAGVVGPADSYSSYQSVTAWSPRRKRYRPSWGAGISAGRSVLCSTRRRRRSTDGRPSSRASSRGAASLLLASGARTSDHPIGSVPRRVDSQGAGLRRPPHRWVPQPLASSRGP